MPLSRYALAQRDSKGQGALGFHGMAVAAQPSRMRGGKWVRRLYTPPQTSLTLSTHPLTGEGVTICLAARMAAHVAAWKGPVQAA